MIPAGTPAPRTDSTGPDGPVLFLVAAFLLVFAPLVRGGNRPMPLLVLESAGLLGLAALAWSHSKSVPRGLPSPLWWGAGILLLYPLVQMIPLPGSWWAALPGRGLYAQALELGGADSGARPMSLHARATEYAWLALIPCLAIFLLVQRLARRPIRRLVLVFAAVAVLEAALGILQAGAGKDSFLQLGNVHGGGAATGTYVNRNHFAALMAMALPMLIAVWATQARLPRDSRGERLREHPRHADRKFASKALLAFVAVLVLLALLLTRSRAGIATGLIAFAVASLMLLWNAGSLSVRVALVAVASAAIGMAAYVGLTPILERFAPEEVSLGIEGRARIATATLNGALEFLPFGSGLGTFADVFRRYQVERLPGFIDHAHNDYAEAFLELGVAGAAAIVLLVLAYGMRWRELARAHPSRHLDHLALGAGLGMLAMLVHAAFDFNFHIPANAIYFSFLAALFFYEPTPA